MPLAQTRAIKVAESNGAKRRSRFAPRSVLRFVQSIASLGYMMQRRDRDYSASATPAKIAFRVPFLRPSRSMTRAPLSRLNML